MADERNGAKSTLWEIAKSVSLFAVAIVICIKAFLAPISISLDAPTLISLLLALFSIWLSALFYFKATETSNTFYDNTYKFTRDISQLLAKMESGFGERLRHLDEGYTSMRNHFQSNGRGANEDVEATKQKLDEEKDELRRTVEERNSIVRDLLERSQLQEGEKERISAQLKGKEEELEKAQEEITKLNRRLFMDRVRARRSSIEFDFPKDEGMNHYTLSRVVDKIGREKVLSAPKAMVQQSFDRLSNDLPRGYIDDLEELGFFDNGLSMKGVEYLRALVKRDAA